MEKNSSAERLKYPNTKRERNEALRLLHDFCPELTYVKLAEKVAARFGGKPLTKQRVSRIVRQHHPNRE